MNAFVLSGLFLVCGDPATDVLAVFTAKCIGCHGSTVKEPKGNFGYILDLKRTAANPEILIPGKLDSNMWKLVSSGNMPPNNSPTGPLSLYQKDVIKRWVESGAPDTVPEPPPNLEIIKPPAEKQSIPVGPSVKEEVAQDSGVLVPPSFLGHIVSWVGNFHLLILHFPIALLVCAALRESWCMWKERFTMLPEYRAVILAEVDYFVVLAALFTIPTVILGWIHAYTGSGSSQSDSLFWHRWLGTFSLVLVGITAVLVEIDAFFGNRTLLTRGMIFFSLLIMSMAAHFGGMMVHGSNFLSW